MRRDCDRIKDQIRELLSGTLGEADERAIRAHLSTCAACREYVGALQDEDASLADHFGQIEAGMGERQVRVLEALACHEAETRISTVPTWRGIMRHRISKLAVAAAILLAVVLGVQQFGGVFHVTNAVYGMTDLPRLLKDVRTLHVQSIEYMYRPDPNQPEFEKAIVIPCEVWVDVPTLRTHFTSFMSWSRPNGERGLNRMEGVHTAEYAMDIDHTKKLVWFNKVSVVQRRPAVRDKIRRHLRRISEGQLDHFVKVGQERIKDTLYDIWEYEDTVPHRTGKRQRVRCWMAPATGELGRMYIWEEADEGRWRLGWCAETIERDIDIPESIFAFDAPSEYTHQNTLETAYEGGLGRGFYFLGGALVTVDVSFTLDDGSVIIGWHSGDAKEDRYQDQSHLFVDLVPGGELPDLPMVIYELRSVRPEGYSPPETVYQGHHLAYTIKDRWYYEWALFVPAERLSSTTGRRLYRTQCRFNLGEEQAPRRGNPISEHRIEADEFDDFVRAAMGELSDNGVAPEHVTYENVMALIKQIRSAGNR